VLNDKSQFEKFKLGCCANLWLLLTYPRCAGRWKADKKRKMFITTGSEKVNLALDIRKIIRKKDYPVLTRSKSIYGSLPFKAIAKNDPLSETHNRTRVHAKKQKR